MRARHLLITASVALSALLLFLLVFESRIAIPAWLQVGGRMHPLLLHFPITLLVLYCGFLLFVPAAQKEESALKPVAEWILVLTAFTSVLTALFGLFLSREEGYDPEALYWHKWSGVLLGVLPLAFYFLRDKIRGGVPRVGAALLGIAAVSFAGHQGAGITHGQNFLLAPMLPEKGNPIVPIEEAEVYAHLVKPILDSKCMSCHNDKKAKGELIMTTEELLLKGGKNGKLWDTTAPELGLLLQRVHLPLEQKKHMPPQGKPQLEDEEIAILYHWIRTGASFSRKVLSFATGDSLRLLAEQRLSVQSGPAYTFDPAPEATLRKLNNANRVVAPVALESPAVSVTFYNSQYYTKSALEELMPIQEQVVQLDLSRMPVKDDELKTIASFPNLEKLTLNFTGITGTGLSSLQGLKKLQQLSLAGTAVKKESLAPLEKMTALRRVIIWNTGLTVSELESLKKQKTPIAYETGFRGDSLVLQLTPPILQNEEQVLTTAVPLRMKHYINGTQIRYTTDGSEPDSLRSPLYDDKSKIEGAMLVKAKAFKPGWISSETIQQYFFKTTFRPDSARFVTKPDPKYTSEGPRSLFNGVKGEAVNFAGGQWLGYRENKMESFLYFSKPVNLQQVTVSCLNAISSYIMRPYRVEVWAGPDEGHLTLQGKVSPTQPDKYEPASVDAVEVKFKPMTASVVKLVVVPVPVLPSWHQGKGEKGWVFVDEVFLN